MFEFLHDATLRKVEFDWPQGAVNITLKTGESESDMATIKAEGVRSIRAPRLAPWGPSNSVNTASVKQFSHDSQCLAIEMQSGDVIEVECNNVTIERKMI